MAKGQMRSNKEKKKPKQDKAKKALGGKSSAQGSSQLNDLFRKVDDDRAAASQRVEVKHDDKSRTARARTP